MLLDEFIIWVYCWVDDHLAQLIEREGKLRRRGFSPALSDAEVITMELVGEFQGKDANKHIWAYFKDHWLAYFPRLGSRSQFGKQAQNLWAVKQQLQTQLMTELGVLNDSVHLVDGFPLPISHFRRAPRCCRFAGEASYGYCASKQEHYFGFKGHLLLDSRGAIAGFTLTPANGSERDAVWELTDVIRGGLLLGDKGYLSAMLREDLRQFRGIELETPVRHNMIDPLPKRLRTQLNRLRRRVETTIGQLVDRFQIERTRARTLWSLTNRLTRKLLSHGLAVLANCLNGLEPLQLEKTVRS